MTASRFASYSGWFAFGGLSLLIWVLMRYLIDVQLDTQGHLSYIEDKLKLSYPLWHWSVIAVNGLTGASMKTAAVLVNTAYNVAAAGFLAYFLHNSVAQLSLNKALWCAVALSLTAALFIPGLSRNLYFGTGSANVWHNPTFFPVKLFQLVCLYYAGRYFITRSMTNFMLTIAALLLSFAAKPSFGLSFVPALVIYAVLIDRSRTSWGEAVRLPLLCVVILGGAALYQYLTLYGSDNIRNASVTIAPFAIWGYYTPSILLSVLCALAFPIALALVVWRSGSIPLPPVYTLAWLNLIVAMLTYMILAETYDGALSYHGNFAWGYYLAMGPLFIASTALWLSHLKTFSRRINGALSALLGLHVVFGLMYILKLFITGSIS